MGNNFGEINACEQATQGKSSKLFLAARAPSRDNRDSIGNSSKALFAGDRFRFLNAARKTARFSQKRHKIRRSTERAPNARSPENSEAFCENPVFSGEEKVPLVGLEQR